MQLKLDGKKFIKRMTVLCMVVLPVFVILFGSISKAATDNNDKQNKTARVGYYDSALFQEGMTEDVPKGGYGYEYLQKISDYSGIKLEYVYGEWTELFAMLENGDIDLMAGVSVTEESRGNMLFPKYSMGTDRFILYQHKDNRVMDTEDYSTFHKKKIGSIRNNRMTDWLEKWAEEKQIALEIQYYDSIEERDEAFRNKELDGLVALGNNALSVPGLVPVVVVGEEPIYLAVTKSRRDLLRDVNDAIALLQELEPYYLQELEANNYGTTIANADLSEIEMQWLATHDTLRIGYMDNYMPYCGADSNGNATGLMTDVVNAMLHVLDISSHMRLKYTAYPTYQDMVDAVQNDEVDIIFPVGGSVWNTEQDGLDATNSVATASMELVYKGDYSAKKLNTIAISVGNKMLRYYVQRYFPEAKIVERNSVDECLQAVSNGIASSTIINGLRVNLVQNNSSYKDLSTLRLEKSDMRKMGVKSGNNALLLLLNRGLNLIGEDYALNASYNYIGDLYTVTIWDAIKNFVYNNIVLVLFILALIILGLVLLMSGSAVKKRQRIWYKEQAYKDGLTALGNRLAYEEAMTAFGQAALPEDFIYVAVDVNGLKRVNDSLGHDAGDELIICAAKCVEEVFGRYGKVYRIGGDEFVALLTREGLSIEELDEAIVKEQKSRTDLSCGEISLSVGYARQLDYPHEEITELAKIADESMYARKKKYYEERGIKR